MNYNIFFGFFLLFILSCGGKANNSFENLNIGLDENEDQNGNNDKCHNQTIILDESIPSTRKLLTTEIDGIDIEIEYCAINKSPGIEFGARNRIPYNKKWRTGNYELPTMNFSDSTMVFDSLMLPGKYSFYTIPRPTSWKIVFNTDSIIFGDFMSWKRENDYLEIESTPLKSDDTETLSIVSDCEQIYINYDRYSLPIKISRVH